MKTAICITVDMAYILDIVVSVIGAVVGLLCAFCVGLTFGMTC